MIEIHKSKDGQYYNVIRSRNGKVIMTSETFKARKSCIKNAKAVGRVLGKTRMTIKEA